MNSTTDEHRDDEATRLAARQAKFDAMKARFAEEELKEQIQLHAPPLFRDLAYPKVTVRLGEEDFVGVFDGSIPDEPEPDQDPFWWAIQVFYKMMPKEQRR